jgi:Protein of unknown function (DUF3054)
MNRPKIGRTAVVSPVLVSTGLVRTMLVSTVLVSTVLDVCCVLAFVAIGRHAHHDGASVAGIWHTAWPFLAGLAIGLGAARAWRRPLTLVPAGLGAWLGAALAGMGLHVLADQGTALAFIGVTLAFLGLFILGWRVLARIVMTRLLKAR